MHYSLEIDELTFEVNLQLDLPSQWTKDEVLRYGWRDGIKNSMQWIDDAVFLPWLIDTEPIGKMSMDDNVFRNTTKFFKQWSNNLAMLTLETTKLGNLDRTRFLLHINLVCVCICTCVCICITISPYKLTDYSACTCRVEIAGSMVAYAVPLSSLSQNWNGK